MTLVGFFFLKVYPHPHPHQEYHAVPESDDPSRPQNLRRSSSEEVKRHHPGGAHVEPGTSVPAAASRSFASSSSPPSSSSHPNNTPDADETSSLVSRCSGVEENLVGTSSVDLDRSHRVDIRGLDLLRNVEFWQLFLIMGNLAGIGLMTIK